jgi:UDP-MurNAc hydroxylase
VIRPYLFFPFTDTALVIRSPDTTILNANDCKIVGLPLQQALSDFPRIDFALRSHSSANARVCHRYIGEPGEPMDDREHYLRSFCNFMRAVRPRYAVPFASNHCHLHRDTVHLNAYIQTPLDVAAYFERFRDQHGVPTQLQLMLPGSSWSEETGFHLVDTTVFAEREISLERYLAEKSATLESYYSLERKVRVTTQDMQPFFERFFRAVPWPVRLAFKGKRILMVCEAGATAASWCVDMWAKSVEDAKSDDVERASMRIHIPAIVLRQSLRMNMFGHAWISKRVSFLATRTDMRYLRLFEFLLECYEVELLPLRLNFTRRSLRSWARRWREPALYLQIVFLLLTGHKLIDIEQALLRKTAEQRSFAERPNLRSTS